MLWTCYKSPSDTNMVHFFEKKNYQKVILWYRDIIWGGYILIKNAFLCPKKGSSLGAILLHKTSQSPIGLLGPYIDFLLAWCAYNTKIGPLKLFLKFDCFPRMLPFWDKAPYRYLYVMTLLQIALWHEYGAFFRKIFFPKSDPRVSGHNLSGVYINKKMHFYDPKRGPR